MKSFVTRKAQIEQDFANAVLRSLTRHQWKPGREVTKTIRDELRGAAMVGATEERSRTLRILREHPHWSLATVAEAIVSHSVLEVLGYED